MNVAEALHILEIHSQAKCPDPLLAVVSISYPPLKHAHPAGRKYRSTKMGLSV
jgi:hypothetical protein